MGNYLHARARESVLSVLDSLSTLRCNSQPPLSPILYNYNSYHLSRKIAAFVLTPI
ncbi:hypothetical protein HanRHA438_Chr05g0231451 [Helianthus annuus]|nr:hypothetical protein HanIR_Chr05g0239341 [Helianthus annuus]KAJ0919595.1 hypothetical protein HanRHA438_Chr05g0231451 [Helianthus annuus]